MPFYDNQNLDDFVRVCFVEQFELIGKDNDNLKMQMIAMLEYTELFEDWIVENIFDWVGIDNKNFRTALLNSLDTEQIILDIYNDLYDEIRPCDKCNDMTLTSNLNNDRLCECCIPEKADEEVNSETVMA